MHVLGKTALICAALLVAGCPSKEGEQKDANAGGSGGPVGQGNPGTPPASGPLAGLESSPFMNEVWNLSGQQVQFLYYARENVRVSAQCRNPAGQLGCAALSQIRGGAPPIVVSRADLSTGKPAGVVGCKKLNNGMTGGVNQAGNEEQFCRFSDGSWMSTNTLEQYSVKIQ